MKDVLSPATGRGKRSTLFPAFPEHALRTAPGSRGREIICTHPTSRADQSTTAAARSQQPQRPVDEAPHLGGPSPKEALPQVSRGEKRPFIHPFATVRDDYQEWELATVPSVKWSRCQVQGPGGAWVKG